MRTFTIKETEIVIQPKITASVTEVEVISVTDDGGCVMASWTFAGKQFSQTLWEEEAYIDIGAWTDEAVNKRITEIINQ